MTSQHLLELLFSQSLDGFFFMMLDEPIVWNDESDKDRLIEYAFAHQRITKVNGAMLAQYGATASQFLGLTPADLYRHDPAAARRIWREFFDRGQMHMKTDERRVDGTPIVIEGDYICLYDDRRRIIGHFGIQRDVSEEVRLQAEVAQHTAQLESRVAERTAELRQSESRIRAIVNAMPDAVLVIDREGVYREVLAYGDRKVLRRPEELVGRHLEEVLPGPVARALLAVVARTIDDRSDGRLEYSLERHGDTQWYEARTAPVLMEGAGDSWYAVVNVRDLTDRKRADELESQNLYLREAFEADLHFGEIHGRSAPMQALFRAIALVANTDSSVLLLGETGTGKELIARAIHRLSRRSGAALVKVNCGALPATLVESELFGHERGAFTGALQQKKGRFDLAHRGTILLDEVGELPLDAQVKLLRVLQEQEFERVGGTQTIRVDTRVIAATNRDLEAEAQGGTFRSDLFYRLNVFPIRVPALRDRRDDIPLLAQHFVREFGTRLGRQIDRIDRRALDKLQAYDWPGNVRELANILERAVILCQDTVLQAAHVGLPVAAAAAGSDAFGTLEDAERRHILRALEMTGGVLAGPRGAASILGINRSTLWSRMRKLGIELPER